MTEESDREEEINSRRRDPELLAMERMVRLLDELADSAKGRVVDWLFSRYVEQHREDH